MDPDRSNYLFAGYVLTERVTRQGSDERLPARFVSASPCLTHFVPDTWCLAWTNDTDEERQAAGVALGMADIERLTVMDLVTAGFEDGRFGWPNVITSRRGLVQLMSVLPRARDWVALGLTLHRRHALSYLEKTSPQFPQEGGGGSHALLVRESA